MIIVGDIHSCADELETIIQKFPNEQVVSCGDLFDRGENGVRVWDLLHEHNIPAVMGNHEYKLLQFLLGERSSLPIHYYVFLNKFAERYELKDLVEYLHSLSYIYELGNNEIVVHGAVDLINPRNTDLSINVYGRCDSLKKVPKDQSSGWWDDYDNTGDENPFVYYGHVSFKKPNVRKKSIGLDTGACHGNGLTYFNTETRELGTISSKDYFAKLKKKYLLDYKPSNKVRDFLVNNKES